MIADFEHVTVNTGASRTSSRSEMQPDALDRMRRMLAASTLMQGKLGDTGWSAVFVMQKAGAYAFDLLHEGQRVVTCILCLDDQSSKPAWSTIDAMPRDPGVRLRRPEETPWLAAFISPNHLAMRDPAMFADILIEAGDLERLIAWCLIDAEP
ncbi:MAG: hypothetical protein JWM58_1645 [Rhizobium sp.]|nr:hypothetical protein [Rhizobium sp.]